MFKGLAALTLGVCLSALPSFSQEAGQIIGVVTDSSSAVVPGATVRMIEAQTGFARTTVTAADGRYVFPNLRPTDYELTAEAAGFRGFRRSGIELLANQSLTVNVALEVGAVTETVTVA